MCCPDTKLLCLGCLVYNFVTFILELQWDNDLWQAWAPLTYLFNGGFLGTKLLLFCALVEISTPEPQKRPWRVSCPVTAILFRNSLVSMLYQLCLNLICRLGVFLLHPCKRTTVWLSWSFIQEWISFHIPMCDPIKLTFDLSFSSPPVILLGLIALALCNEVESRLEVSSVDSLWLYFLSWQWMTKSSITLIVTSL